MIVDHRDGQCRECGGSLEILDADDATMLVECTNPKCTASYTVESDDFGDGASHYYPAFMMAKFQKRGSIE